MDSDRNVCSCGVYYVGAVDFKQRAAKLDSYYKTKIAVQRKTRTHT